MKNQKQLISVIIVVVIFLGLLLGGYIYINRQNSLAPTDADASSSSSSSSLSSCNYYVKVSGIDGFKSLIKPSSPSTFSAQTLLFSQGFVNLEQKYPGIKSVENKYLTTIPFKDFDKDTLVYRFNDIRFAGAGNDFTDNHLYLTFMSKPLNKWYRLEVSSKYNISTKNKTNNIFIQAYNAETKKYETIKSFSTNFADYEYIELSISKNIIFNIKEKYGSRKTYTYSINQKSIYHEQVYITHFTKWVGKSTRPAYVKFDSFVVSNCGNNK